MRVRFSRSHWPGASVRRGLSEGPESVAAHHCETRTAASASRAASWPTFRACANVTSTSSAAKPAATAARIGLRSASARSISGDQGASSAATMVRSVNARARRARAAELPAISADGAPSRAPLARMCAPSVWSSHKPARSTMRSRAAATATSTAPAQAATSASSATVSQVGGGNGALEDVQRIERQRQLQQAREAGKRERRAQRAAHLGQQLPRRGHRDTTDNRPPLLRGGSHRDSVTGA